MTKQGYLRSQRILKAMIEVPRKEFVPEPYRDYAYLEVPLPLPGHNAMISCPHSYPMFYEALGPRERENAPLYTVFISQKRVIFLARRG